MHGVHAHLRKQMESQGMRVRIDAVGNLRGLWVPNKAHSKRLIIGSHLDTVPNAGAFDGVLGIIIGLEWVLLAQEMNLEIPIEVIGFSEEEGVRFGVPFLGSRAVAGCFDLALLSLQDSEGVSVEDAIRAFGLDPSEIGQAAIAEDLLGFVEIHIEQGPVLDSARLSVASVTGIVGQTRGTLRFTGQANHAGTTPMHLRRDALAAAAEWILGVEQFARGQQQLVATVGRIQAEPNAGNVIPGKVEVTLDCRHADNSVRLAALNELLGLAGDISSRRGVEARWHEHLNQPTVPMDARLTEQMTEAIREAGFPPTLMTSGAGHDAMIMATRHPATMLFVRSPGGISHDPSESVLAADIEASLSVGRRFLGGVARGVR